VITAKEGAEPHESDVATTDMEEWNGEIMLGCSGRNSLKEGAV
jgi:hypothetical protein